MRVVLTILALSFAAAAVADLSRILEPVRPSPDENTTAPGPVRETPAPTADAVPLREELVRKQLAALLKEYYEIEGDLRIAFLREWRGPRVPVDEWTPEIVQAPAKGLQPHSVIRFAVNVGEETVGQWAMPLRVELWQSVWVTRRAFRRSEPLQEADLTQQSLDVLRLPDAPVSTQQSFADLELVRPVSENTPLLWRDVVERPLVRRNALVEVIAVEGLLQISMPARAIENGREGDMITVRNLDSKRDFQALVIDENTVRVYF